MVTTTKAAITAVRTTMNTSNTISEVWNWPLAAGFVTGVGTVESVTSNSVQ